MVIKNLENKIRLVTIICGFFLLGCIIISVSSIWTAKTMVNDAQKRSMFWIAMCLFWYNEQRWKKHLMWKLEAILRCSIISSSHLHQMTNISNIR